MPMHYIKITVYLLLTTLTSCSQTLVQDDADTEGTFSHGTPKKLTTNVLEEYKAALYAMRDKQLNVAKPVLLKITTDYPDLAGPHANIGIIYYKQGEFENALRSSNTALAKNPRNAYAHNTLASIYQQQGKFTLAEKHFLLAINYKQDYAIAHYNIALLYDIFFQKISASINHYKKYLSIIKKKGGIDKQTTNWLEQLENSLKRG